VATVILALPNTLALPLFVAWIVAHDVDHAAAAHDLTAFTDALNAGADLHGENIPTENDRLGESESV
jgi:hypothetical protein